MLSIFIEGLMLGFGAAVPLGPINLLIMNEVQKMHQTGHSSRFYPASHVA